MEQTPNMPEQAKHVSPFQILSFVFGLVGTVLSFVTTVTVMWLFVMTAAHSESPYITPIPVSIVMVVIILLCGLAAVVLGIVGLVIDSKKRQRPAGLVFAVLGIQFGATALLFLLCVLFWSFWAGLLMRGAMLH